MRLMGMIDACDAALALPGGVGTLTEISSMWNHLLVGAITPRPLILVGTGWEVVTNAFYQAMDAYIPTEQRAWITVAHDIDSAVEHLRTFASSTAV
jgi:hypothetical protein